MDHLAQQLDVDHFYEGEGADGAHKELRHGVVRNALPLIVIAVLEEEGLLFLVPEQALEGPVDELNAVRGATQPTSDVLEDGAQAILQDASYN